MQRGTDEGDRPVGRSGLQGSVVPATGRLGAEDSQALAQGLEGSLWLPSRAIKGVGEEMSWKMTLL